MALYVVMLLWVVDGCWQHTLNFKTAGKGWGQGVVPSRRSVCSCFLLFLVRYVGCSRLEGGRCVYVCVRACVCVCFVKTVITYCIIQLCRGPTGLIPGVGQRSSRFQTRISGRDAFLTYLQFCLNNLFFQMYRVLTLQ